MAKIQYLDLTGLTTYDKKIKAHVSSELSKKSDSNHNHDDKYDEKGSASSMLQEAKNYADGVKNDLLNGAGEAYDSLLELGNLIDDNTDAIEALETVAASKADKTHKHTVADITDLTVDVTELNYMDGTTSNVQAQLDSKLSLSGGTMTGEIILAQNTLAKRDIDTSGVIIYGGTEFSNSASIAVYGKDQANYSGRFRLIADNGEETCTLEGRPNGVLKWDGQNVLTDDDKTEIQTQLDNKVSKFGSTMTGNLEICNNMEQSPMLTISGTANESGVRASSYIIKAANSMSNGGTEIVDEGFDTTSTSLIVNNNAGLSGSLKLRKMNSDYSIANYSIYGEHNKPTPDDIGAAPASHEHSASKITSGILAVEQGGTGNMWGYVRAGAQEGSTIGSLATAEGRETIASGYCSHAEGNYCEATGTGSHAEGQNTEASGTAAHSEGESTEAGGNFSHAEGEKTVASGKWQHVQGKYNIEDTTDTYAHIVGNGESNSTRSNAHTLDWDGNAWFAGDVTVTDDNGNSVSVLGLINRISQLETMLGNINAILDDINGEVI